MSISRPPAARRVRSERTFHGDTVIDEYAWLGDKDDPETINFLEGENAYTEAMTADSDGLRQAIFGEIKARTQETDLSVPTRKGGWWYYGRTVEGQQYGVFCRRAVRPGESRPPMRSRTRSTARPGRGTARRCSTSPSTTHGGRTGCGGT